MATAGYSSTPLFKKLGIKTGHRVRTHNVPSNYLELISPVPAEVTLSTRIAKKIHIWHLFTKSARELEKLLPRMIQQIEQNGAIWISWPKKSSGVQSDIKEDTIRELALPLGLVDVKVCAIDHTWSGLKLVIRKELRRK